MLTCTEKNKKELPIHKHDEEARQQDSETHCDSRFTGNKSLIIKSLLFFLFFYFISLDCDSVCCLG